MKKLLKIALPLSLSTLLFACAAQPAKVETTETTTNQHYDKKISEAPPVDQVKKAYLEKDAEFGNFTFKISESWIESNMNNTRLYILNDVTGTHIQIESIDQKMEDGADKVTFLSRNLESLFGTLSTDVKIIPLSDTSNSLYGQEGVIKGNNETLHNQTFFLYEEKDGKLYRFSLVADHALNEDDKGIFENMLKSLKNK